MDEVENQTKKELVVLYIFNSMMIVGLVFTLLASAIVFSPDEIINEQVRLGATFGFIALMWIMAIMLGRNLDSIFDVIYKLNEGEYK